MQLEQEEQHYIIQFIVIHRELGLDYNYWFSNYPSPCTMCGRNTV